MKGIQDKLDAAKKAHPEFANQTAVPLSWYKDSVAPSPPPTCAADW